MDPGYKIKKDWEKIKLKDVISFLGEFIYILYT